MEINSGKQAGAVDVAPVVKIAFDLRQMTQQQLAALGVSQIAYVKPVVVNGGQGFAIHAADGTPMAVTDDRDVAIAAIVQHEMHPLSVH
jgi:hypothetical protein